MLKFIKNNYSGEIITRYNDGLDIDIYLPELKIGFECNGLYQHSEKFKDNNYHFKKTEHFKEKGIKIIHIWEDDWIFSRKVIESQIINFIGKSKKIYARKCIVRQITDTKAARKFLDENHIQGFMASTFKVGLYHNDELVSIMSFDTFEGRLKMEPGGYNINRFCNLCGYTIIGGASKLLNWVTKEYNVVRYVSYADKDWSTGDLYHKLGFKNVGGNGPDYKYIVDGKRVHKSRYKKSNIGYDVIGNLTERQYMQLNGFHRIYDCGKIKFELRIKE